MQTLDKHPIRLLHLLFGAFSLIFWLGCLVPDGGSDASLESSLGGTVGGEAFSVSSGSAELNVDNKYVITLADTPEFSCTSSSGLPSNYLQIVIGEIDDASSFDADGRVFFNVFEDGVSVGEPADSGTITIDTIDEFGGVIEGSVDAVGETSSVSGRFSVDICR